MAPRPLSEMCIRKCTRNLSSLTSIGDMSYQDVRPILLKLESATHLRQLEEACPQLEGEDAEVWQKLIQRDFSELAKKGYHPKNPLSWYRVYAKYKREQDAEVQRAEAQLVNSFAKFEAEKNSNTSRIVDQRMLPKPPGGKRRFGGSDRPSASSKTAGQSFLQKARREAQQIASRRTLTTSTGALKVRPGQIKKAPAAMVNDYRVAAQTDVRIRVPKSQSGTKRDLELAQREARLLAAKKSAVAADVVLVSDSEEDEDDHQDDSLSEWDLFDDAKHKVVVRPPISPQPQKASPLLQPKKAVTLSAHKPGPILVASSRKPGSGSLSNASREARAKFIVDYVSQTRALSPPKNASPTRKSTDRSPHNRLQSTPMKPVPIASSSSPSLKPIPRAVRPFTPEKPVVRAPRKESKSPPTSEPGSPRRSLDGHTSPAPTAAPPAVRVSPPASPKEDTQVFRKRKAPVDIFMPKKKTPQRR